MKDKTLHPLLSPSIMLGLFLCGNGQWRLIEDIRLMDEVDSVDEVDEVDLLLIIHNA